MDYPFQYPEYAPQLLLQAFLQRLVDGGGRSRRDYGRGRGHTDLCVEWPVNGPEVLHGPLQTAVLELKVLRQTPDPEAALAQALKQTAAYADTKGADEAYIVLFDRRAGLSWTERIWQRLEHQSGREIGVWGM